MNIRNRVWSILAGGTAGIVNGLFGAGGGMVLVPMLSGSGAFTERELFSSSVVVILPLCLISLAITTGGSLPWKEAWPYLVGGIPGGLAAALLGRKIPLIWLHRFLGVLILYGGIRYLC